ncbi:hypothetical protein RGQ29_002414 [Quercus rubra]|uniref:Uncharacterized protein n=1 Tax=Quercus rubra TaxID=3512 RepID=A0AAN7E8Y2_QUERU|nr:hypothetical protein RGQ29_002414 [Quercus rubra]
MYLQVLIGCTYHHSQCIKNLDNSSTFQILCYGFLT